MYGSELIDADGETVRRVGTKAQLNPVPIVVGVDAAHFDRPSALRGFEHGAVEVDKKLVGVGNRCRGSSCEADFSNHVGERVQIWCLEARRDRRNGFTGAAHERASGRVKILDRHADTEGLGDICHSSGGILAVAVVL